jgi:hypothetical protein
MSPANGTADRVLRGEGFSILQFYGIFNAVLPVPSGFVEGGASPRGSNHAGANR